MPGKMNRLTLQSIAPVKAISAIYDDLQAVITKVAIKDPNGVFVIWEYGVTTPHESPIGKGIELHIWMRTTSGESGSHTGAVTVKTNLPAPYDLLAKKWTGLTGSTESIDYDFNLSNMPETPVIIYSITPWISPNKAVTDLPPREEW